VEKKVTAMSLTCMLPWSERKLTAEGRMLGTVGWMSNEDGWN